MAKKTRRGQLQSLVCKIAELTEDCEAEVIRANRERDAALAELRSHPLDENTDGEPITADGLGQFMDYAEKNGQWRASYGRLTMWCKLDGQWGMVFDATFGGGIGSYRRLKNMTEVRVLVELLGVKTRERLRAAEV